MNIVGLMAYKHHNSFTLQMMSQKYIKLALS
jgi:hypothetical protein